ncbi:hypothetical protein GCM10027592_57100 [Spirosoma flavus]
MRKGQIVVLGKVVYDPDKIAHFDFGRNQFGQRRCRCVFMNAAEEGGGVIGSKEDYGMLLEFAETNNLVRERDYTFGE